jgi:hypothetical protein
MAYALLRKKAIAREWEYHDYRLAKKNTVNAPRANLYNLQAVFC